MAPYTQIVHNSSIEDMGANYAKYCHSSSMVKHPVECFEATKGHREAVHGPTDFALIVKGKLVKFSLRELFSKM